MSGSASPGPGLTADPGARWAFTSDRLGRLALGCADGGTLTLGTIDRNGRAAATLDGCAWASRGTFDGTGWFDLDTGDAFLDLRGDRGHVTLDGEVGGWRVTGTWDGKTVDERP